MYFRLIALILFFSAGLSAQVSDQKTRILFIFDASQSMFGHFGGASKIDVAQKLLSEALDSLHELDNVELALRVYGNRSNINNAAQNCEDTHLEVPFGPDNVAQIKHVIKAVVPKGTTPIARSLELSENDFPPCTNCRNVIVLITDGIEACDGDPCAIAKALRKNNVFLKPFVIGVGVIDDYKEHFYCIGNYYDAKDPAQFKSVLSLVLAEALNNTTCQVDLLNVYGKPLETNVNMTFKDHFSGEIKYNYVHTMNHMNLPDTLSIDPSMVYDITVHTLPKVEVSGVKIKPAQHNVISIETPQGSIVVRERNGSPLRRLVAKITQTDSCRSLHFQDAGDEVKYLVGSYEVEVNTLPITQVSVEVAQSETAVVEVEQSGRAIFNILSPGYGSIYSKSGNQVALVYSLDSKNPSESIDLQPGTYLLVYREMQANRSFQTVEKEFVISSGKTVRISI